MGVAAHLLGPRHIFHLSREALAQPPRTTLVRRKLYRGDSDQLKTQSLSLCFDSKRKRVFILRYHRAPALARIIHCQANDQDEPPDRRHWAYTLRRPANQFWSRYLLNNSSAGQASQTSLKLFVSVPSLLRAHPLIDTVSWFFLGA